MFFMVIFSYSTMLFSVDIKPFDFSRLRSKLYVPLSSIAEVKKSEVKNGQGLYQALRNVGIPNKNSLSLINSLRDEVEFSLSLIHI